MTEANPDFSLRISTPGDQAAFLSIYPLAFPNEDMVPLLRELWQEPENCLSLVVFAGEEPAGHAMFTRCNLHPESAPVALLGPVAVRPDQHGHGLGSALIQEGLRRLRQEGTALVCVLGDPAYYSRFGFEPTRRILPPYGPSVPPPEWEGAWQSIALTDAAASLSGRLVVPRAWDNESLWLP